MKFQSVKGMDDLFGPELAKWQALEDYARNFFEAYGFREIRTPILESTELFARSIGEATDIVHKEMYTFQDRGGRSLTLRPEMTASVVRAALEHHLLQKGEPLFLYYLGPMFRAERPQAGRKRQFYQIGVETLNTHSAVNDAELVVMIAGFLNHLGLKKFTVKLNHLGSAEDRASYSEELARYFKKVQNKLCPDCQYRLERNVLRIFDCKNEACQPLIREAPKRTLSKDAKSNFDEILSLLNEAGVNYREEPRLVRGIDYYTGFVFEVTGEGLGAQDAVLAGGRYDSLIHELGGDRMGASGFSIGVERLLTALQAANVSLEREILADTVYVAALVHGKESCAFYRRVAEGIFSARRRAHFSFSEGSIANHMKRANKMNAGFVIIIGPDEWKAGEVMLKNMKTGAQKRMKPEALAEGFRTI